MSYVNRTFCLHGPFWSNRNMLSATQAVFLMCSDARSPYYTPPFDIEKPNVSYSPSGPFTTKSFIFIEAIGAAVLLVSDLFSGSSLFRHSLIPTLLYSDKNVFENIFPTILYSDVSIFQHSNGIFWAIAIFPSISGLSFS